MKKHKGKSARRLAKERRQAVKRSKRREASRGAWPPGGRDARDSVRELLPLLDEDDRHFSSPNALAELMLKKVTSSDSLAEEPELREMLISPLECIEAFAEATTELGVDPNSLGKVEMPEGAREDLYLDLLDKVGRRVLTEDVRHDLCRRLIRVRERCKRTGERDKSTQAALAEMALSQDSSPEIAVVVGLVRAILLRSLQAAFELGKTMKGIAEAAFEDTSGLPLADRLLPAIRSSEAAKQLFQKIPGLQRVLSDEMDEAIDKGRDAFLSGHPCLGLYTLDEILEVMKSMRRFLPAEPAEDATGQTPPIRQASSSEAGAMISALGQYCAEILQGERLEQACARIKQAIEEPDFKGFGPFLGYLLSRLEAGAPDEADRHLLAGIAYGELQAWAERGLGEDEPDDADELDTEPDPPASGG